MPTFLIAENRKRVETFLKIAVLGFMYLPARSDRGVSGGMLRLSEPEPRATIQLQFKR